MEEQLWYGKYRPIGLIYAGEDIEVFEIEHRRLGERRVLKRATAGTRAAAVLRAEAELLGRFRHPLVPELYDTEEDENEFAAIEELICGETLKARLESGKETEVESAIEYCCMLCEILTALHSFEGGYIHCDIKPENLMISGKKLMLIDFGSAVKKGNDAISALSFGTSDYAAPEQLEGGLRDERTDIYACGRIIRDLLPTLQAKNRREKSVISKLAKIAEKATEEYPENRFANAAELLLLLERCRDRGKRKPKPAKQHRNGVCTVGVIGTHHGTGVTNTVLAAANYLRNVAGKRVAVVELSGTDAMSCLVKYPLERGKESSQPGPCRVAGFDVFAGADSLLAGAVRNGNYDYCIYDLGCSSGRRLQELLRCDRKLILTDSAPWHRSRRQAIDKLLSYAETSDNWWLLYNMSNRTTPEDCRRLPVKAEWRAFSPDPFDITAQDEKLFGKLLSAS